MASHFSPSQQAVIDQDNRQQSAAGYPLSQTLNDLYAQIATGAIGIQSAAADVDSVCLGGGEFTQDTGTSSGATLSFSWLAGRFHNGKSLVNVSAGTLTLAASSTNYVEVNRAGVVSSNTVGFTSGRLPLWTVVTSAGGWVQSGVTSFKPHLCLIGANGVDGSMLSVPAGTKELSIQMGAISGAGSASFLAIAPNVAATLALAEFVNASAVAASDTNYWTITITNLATGAGTTVMLNAAGANNTTKLTGGSALVAFVAKALNLSGTPSNLNTNPNDVLQITFTPTGVPGNLSQASMRLDFTFQT